MGEVGVGWASGELPAEDPGEAAPRRASVPPAPSKQSGWAVGEWARGGAGGHGACRLRLGSWALFLRRVGNH